MLDAEDRGILLYWVVRIVACWVMLFSSAAALGLALRLFDLIRG